MISAKHHVLNILISLPTLFATPIRTLLRDELSINYDIQAVLEYSIAFYALWFCLYLIEARTTGSGSGPTSSTTTPSASTRSKPVRRVRGFLGESAGGCDMGCCREEGGV